MAKKKEEAVVETQAEEKKETAKPVSKVKKERTKPRSKPPVKKINSKKYTQTLAKYDNTKEYSIAEACSVVKELSTSKFDGSVEVHVRLSFDTTRDSVRSSVKFPHGTGKTKRIIVFADDKISADAKKAGAVEAGGKDLIEKIQKGWFDFDLAIAHPALMPEVGKLGKILGTKGLMPNPKAGTITADIVSAIEEFSTGKEEFKADGSGIVHKSIGKISFASEKIQDNLRSLLEALKKAKPAKVKGKYFLSMFLSPTMGPSVKVSLSEIQ